MIETQNTLSMSYQVLLAVLDQSKLVLVRPEKLYRMNFWSNHSFNFFDHRLFTGKRLGWSQLLTINVYRGLIYYDDVDQTSFDLILTCDEYSSGQ